MGGICSRHGEMINVCKFYLENPTIIGQLGDVHIDGRILLK
jgi:hypothetical protein